MSNSAIDNNREATALAVDTNGATEPLRVDVATSRLLINIDSATTTSPATLSAKIDENRIGTSYGVTDNTDLTVTTLIIDNRSGFLFVDLLLE